MNTKFYVPFETAKMLKAQGYPQSGSDMYYNPNGELKTQVELIAGYKEDYPTMIKYYIAATAYCEVLDWLTEKDIDVDVYMTVDNTFFSSICKHGRSEYYLGELPTREQAINAAIIKALEELL